MKALAIRIFADLRSPVLSGAAWRAVGVAGFALATAAAAQIKIPVPGTPVPATLQTAIVLLAGLRLGSRGGALSQIVYVACGAIGLPFFAGATGGAAALFGPTGGYLVGFILAAWLAGRLSGGTRPSFARAWCAALAASVALFVPGVVTLKLFTSSDWSQAFAMGVLPFALGDLVKVTLAAVAHRALPRP